MFPFGFSPFPTSHFHFSFVTMSAPSSRYTGVANVAEMKETLKELKNLLLSHPTPANEWRVKQLERNIENLEKGEHYRSWGGSERGGSGSVSEIRRGEKGTTATNAPEPFYSSRSNTSSYRPPSPKQNPTSSSQSFPAPSSSLYRDRMRTTELKQCPCCGISCTYIL